MTQRLEPSWKIESRWECYIGSTQMREIHRHMTAVKTLSDFWVRDIKGIFQNCIPFESSMIQCYKSFSEEYFDKPDFPIRIQPDSGRRYAMLLNMLHNTLTGTNNQPQLHKQRSTAQHRTVCVNALDSIFSRLFKMCLPYH